MPTFRMRRGRNPVMLEWLMINSTVSIYLIFLEHVSFLELRYQSTMNCMACNTDLFFHILEAGVWPPGVGVASLSLKALNKDTCLPLLGFRWLPAIPAFPDSIPISASIFTWPSLRPFLLLQEHQSLDLELTIIQYDLTLTNTKFTNVHAPYFQIWSYAEALGDHELEGGGTIQLITHC